MAITFDVDERTDSLSDAALVCRSRRAGHNWQEKAISRSRLRELVDLGVTEENLFCPDCGTALAATYDLKNGEQVGSVKMDYGEGYLLPKNSGRLRRSAARVARNARILARLT